MTVKNGVLHADYHDGRKTKRSMKYRLSRRTSEVLKAIRTHKGDAIDSILDVGTADAMMLDELNRNMNPKNAVGLDLSIELLRTNRNPELCLVRGDALGLPFDDDTFDVLVATAVIEHVREPEKMAAECRRVLKTTGICILTTPDPFFEKIAARIGHLEKEQHNETFGLPELGSLFESAGFRILRADRFMMSPIGFPCEEKIERAMKSAGFGFLLINQLLVCRK